MSAAQIKRELYQRWAEDAVLPVCVRIIEFVAELPSDQRVMLTFRSLCEATKKDSVDDELLRALTILISSRIAALTAWGLLVDDDETEYVIDPDTLATARREGLLVHPETGEAVSEFEARVMPFFAASKRFETDAHEAR
jgi:hypothetical protein